MYLFKYNYRLFLVGVQPCDKYVVSAKNESESSKVRPPPSKRVGSICRNENPLK